MSLFQKLICVVMALLFQGCLSTPRFQESYTREHKLDPIICDTLVINVSSQTKADRYWIPISDTYTSKCRSFIIRIEQLDSQTGQSDIVQCDLMERPEADELDFPSYIGSTTHYGFWAPRTGYYVVDFKTAEVTHVSCRDGAIENADTWIMVDPKTVRRIGKLTGRVFDLSVTGASEVTDPEIIAEMKKYAEEERVASEERAAQNRLRILREYEEQQAKKNQLEETSDEVTEEPYRKPLRNHK